jgi:hypothetical protein
MDGDIEKVRDLYTEGPAVDDMRVYTRRKLKSGSWTPRRVSRRAAVY